MARARRSLAGASKPKAPMCPCGQSLATGSKTFWGGAWRCDRCTYQRDHPGTEIMSQPRRRALPLQEEKLFEIPVRRDDR